MFKTERNFNAYFDMKFFPAIFILTEIVAFFLQIFLPATEAHSQSASRKHQIASRLEFLL